VPTGTNRNTGARTVARTSETEDKGIVTRVLQPCHWSARPTFAELVRELKAVWCEYPFSVAEPVFLVAFYGSFWGGKRGTCSPKPGVIHEQLHRRLTSVISFPFGLESGHNRAIRSSCVMPQWTFHLALRCEKLKMRTPPANDSWEAMTEKRTHCGLLRKLGQSLRLVT